MRILCSIKTIIRKLIIFFILATCLLAFGIRNIRRIYMLITPGSEKVINKYFYLSV